jgi:arabinofuranosyltransferase
MLPSIFTPSRLFFLSGLLLVGLIFSLLPHWTVDDAFISYRYGANLALFGEFTWNVGASENVEGYTGIFLPLLAAFLTTTGLPLIGTIQLLGIFACFGILGLIDGVLRDRKVTHPIRGAIFLLAIASPLLYVHALSGLESIFFTFFFIGAVRFADRWWNSKKNAGVWLCLFVVLAGITRPEGLLIGWLLLLLVVLQVKAYRKVPRKPIHFLSLLFSIVPPLVWWLWRTSYYKDFFPNTFYAKSFDGIVCPDSVKTFLQFGVYYCLLPLGIGLLAYLLTAKQILKKPSMGIMLGFAFVGACLLAYLRSHLYMNYASRFFLPFFPFILVISGLLLQRFHLAVRKTQTSKIHRKAWAALLIVGAACQTLVFGIRWQAEGHFLNYYSSIVNEELVPAGQYLRAHLPPGATVISYMDAGAVGYYSGLRVIDFGRLNDRYLAKEKPSPGAVRDYFFAQDADAIVLTSESETMYSYIQEAEEIVSDSRFSRYELVVQFGNSASYPYWQRIYILKEPKWR